jgi:hypothetical protein
MDSILDKALEFLVGYQPPPKPAKYPSRSSRKKWY